MVDEIDERSAESRQVIYVPEVVNSSFTDRREVQNCGSDGGAMERRGATVSSSLATVLADHTPQVVTTQRCKPKARLLINAECFKDAARERGQKETTTGGKGMKAKTMGAEKNSKRARNKKKEERKGKKSSKESR